MACSAPSPTRAAIAAAALVAVWLLPLAGTAGAAVEITSVEQNLAVDPHGRVVDVTFSGPVSLQFSDDNARFEIDLVRPLGRDVSFCVADLNGDGIDDLFGASFAELVYFYPGLGSRPYRFGRGQVVRRSTDGSESPYAFMEGIWQGCAIADFDGNGTLEILVGSEIYEPVTPGDPTLVRHGGSLADSPFTWDPFPSAGDLDGDGKPDVVVTPGYSNQAYLFRNQSTPGTYAFQEEVLTTYYAFDYAGERGLAVADVNNDGLLDLTSYRGMYFNTGTATNPVFDFNNPTPYTVRDGPWLNGVHSDRGISMVLRDGDGDGLVDAFVSNCGTSTWQGYFYRNVGMAARPEFAFEAPLLSTSAPYHHGYRTDDEPHISLRRVYLATGDVTRNGHTDLLISDGHGSFVTDFRSSSGTVLWNRGSRRFAHMDVYTFFTEGYPELNPYEIWFFESNWLPDVTLLWRDLTGDGREDVVSADGFIFDENMDFYFHRRTGVHPVRFAAPQLLTTTTGATVAGIGLAPIDLDRNGATDFILGQGDGSLVYHCNTGSDANLMLAPPTPVTDASDVPLSVDENSWPTTMDWDGDGDEDLLVADQDGMISIFLNHQGKFTSAGYLGIAGWDPIDMVSIFGGGVLTPSLVTVDLNRDGRRDLLAGDDEFSTVWYFERKAGSGPPELTAEVVSVERTIPGHVEKLNNRRYRLYFGIPVQPGETCVYFYEDLTRTAPVSRCLGGAPPGPCVEDDFTLCLAGGRFRVEVTWRDFAGNVGAGRVAPVGSENSGLYWFFDPENWEMLVKVLNGCSVNDRYWVFAAATTNVEYTLRVTDTETAAFKEYFNPLGTAAPALTDTGAFAACP